MNIKHCLNFVDYYSEGFLFLQSAISSSIAKAQAIKYGKLDFEEPEVKLRRFPYPSYIDDILLQAMSTMISLIMVLAFQYTAISIIKVITTEKERQLKVRMQSTLQVER